MTTPDKLPPLAERIASIHHDMLDGFEFNTDEAQNYVTEELSRVVEMAQTADALIRQQEARIAELEAELAKFRRLARSAASSVARHRRYSLSIMLDQLLIDLAALHKEE